MNRELKKLLKDINNKKQEVINLANANKIEEAKAAKKELIDLQAKFNTLYDLDDEYENEQKENIFDNGIGLTDKLNNNNDKAGKLIVNAIYPNEKINLKSKNSIKSKDINLGNLIRGMAGRGWEGSNVEKEFYQNSMTAGGTKVIIPTQLSEKILDLARSESAIFGNIPIVPMENNNMAFVVQTKDATAHFVAEEELIPESDASFKVSKLYGKTIAIFIPLTEQLLDSTSNLTAQLENSCARAIAIGVDKALMYGNGNGTEESKEIKGLSSYEEINKITHDGEIDYDFIVKGIGAVKENNITPSNIAYNSNIGTQLALLKDSSGQYITPPIILNDYKTSESNNIEEKEAVIFDMNSLVLGINKTIKIEYGNYNDSFQKLMKGLRVHMRIDLGVLRPKGIAISKVQS